MTIRHHDRVDQQFGEQAGAYFSSSVHATGNDLLKLGERLQAFSGARLLDIGCGAGHASFIAAQHVKEVVAYDLSEQMLAVVNRAAKDYGYPHLITRQGYAEKLPFADNEFDIVISRYSAHHWHDVGSTLREVRRVLKPGGRAIFMDVNSPGNPVLDIWLQTVEALRDTSHVRNYTPGEWLTFFTESGLTISQIAHDRLELEYGSWIARMRTPEVMSRAIRAYQHSAPDDVKQYFRLQADGSFTTDIIFIEVNKPG